MIGMDETGETVIDTTTDVPAIDDYVRYIDQRFITDETIETQLQKLKTFEPILELHSLEFLVIQERVDAAINLISRKLLYSDIVRGMRQIFPQLLEGQIAKAIQVAQRILNIYYLRRHRKDFRVEAVAFYESICRDPMVKMKDRLTAQAELTKLMGLTQRKQRSENTADNNSDVSLDKLIADRRAAISAQWGDAQSN